jgi:hypothetical protein
MGIAWRRICGIDPAEMAVRPTVNHAYSAVGSVTKYQDRRASHVKFRHRLADREAF